MKSSTHPEPLESLWNQLGLEHAKVSFNPEQEAVLLEALTHTSSGINPHHEQLEFLGDAVLRLTASEFIASKYPTMPVGERSSLRAHLVSDRWLAELGEQIEIERWWRIGAKARGDHTASATIRAELSEALIGAIYRIAGTEAVEQWLTPYWLRSADDVLLDPHRGNSKSALQEWSQGHNLGLPNYDSQEVSQKHGDPRRFHCTINLSPNLKAEGWGGSRREAEQQAARNALAQLTER